MQESVTYDKVYLDDNYKNDFAELRNRYHDRVRNALLGRSVDHNPTSNVSEFFFLNDNGDGGVTLTAGDFVAYFNHRFGGGDRLDAMKRSIECAVSREKSRNENKLDQKASEQPKRRSPKITLAERIRTAQRRFSFVHAVFALMLMLSLLMMLGSSLVLDRTTNDVAAIEGEITMLQQELDERAGGADRDAAKEYGLVAEDAQVVSYLELAEGDSVEIFEAEKKGPSMSALLNAISSLFE